MQEYSDLLSRENVYMSESTDFETDPRFWYISPKWHR